MSEPPILLVGAGPMAVAYAHVLSALDTPMTVAGRGPESAATFAAATGIEPTTGPLDQQLDNLDDQPGTAIVAVNAMHLTDVATQLAERGVRRLLIEKPAALDAHELERLTSTATSTGTEVIVGYNRRYVESVRRARSIVADDGGVLSVKCDFSEPSRRIASLDKPTRELDTWFYGNSSHVVDLALHFAGDCSTLVGEVSGGVEWHPAGGVFVGHGRSDTGALLAWHANWMGPGRWGAEVITAEHRIILQPLEQLRVQSHASFDEVPVDLDLSLDRDYKPGLMRQVRAFLFGDEAEHLCTLAEHHRRFGMYESIRLGTKPTMGNP